MRDAEESARVLALSADKLRDIAATGAHYADNPYDKANYANITEIALELTALAVDTPAATFELHRATHFMRLGPVSTVDGAIFNADDQLCLIHRADNQQWALPGGKIDVGESAATAVVREVWEETGLRVEAAALMGVFDSLIHAKKMPIQLYQFLFLCRPLGAAMTEVHYSQQLEVLDVGWFSAETLPSNLDPGHVSRISFAFDYLNGNQTTFFDHEE